ncbi:IS110 family transposase, partial [Streptomyces chartreusis]
MPAALPAVHAVEVATESRVVVLGVDTHKDVHVAAVLDHLGRLLSSGEF